MNRQDTKNSNVPTSRSHTQRRRERGGVRRAGGTRPSPTGRASWTCCLTLLRHREGQRLPQHGPARSPRNFSPASKEQYRPTPAEKQRISAQGPTFARLPSDFSWKMAYRCAAWNNRHCWSSYRFT